MVRLDKAFSFVKMLGNKAILVVLSSDFDFPPKPKVAGSSPVEDNVRGLAPHCTTQVFEFDIWQFGQMC